MYTHINKRKKTEPHEEDRERERLWGRFVVGFCWWTSPLLRTLERNGTRWWGRACEDLCTHLRQIWSEKDEHGDVSAKHTTAAGRGEENSKVT